jgi:choline kinase
MRGIILAAGRGGRLAEVLKGTPKCLLEFGGKPIILHQIDAMKACGINEFVVVVGYEQQQIRDILSPIASKIHFIDNPIYLQTNTLYSLRLAVDFFDDDFIYFNGDILCDRRTVASVANPHSRSILACVKHPCGDEEVKVIVEGKRITEIGKHIDPAQCFGEFIGVACFGKTDNVRFREILNSCASDQTLWNRYFEHAVNILAKEKNLECADITHLPITEIDFPKDVETARNEVLPRLTAP